MGSMDSRIRFDAYSTSPLSMPFFYRLMGPFDGKREESRKMIRNQWPSSCVRRSAKYTEIVISFVLIHLANDQAISLRSNRIASKPFYIDTTQNTLSSLERVPSCRAAELSSVCVLCVLSATFVFCRSFD